MKNFTPSETNQLRRNIRHVFLIGFVGLLALVPLTSSATPTIHVLVLKGDPLPDGQDNFGSFGIPALNNNGVVAFSAFADTVNSDKDILCRASIGTVVKVVRGNQAFGSDTYRYFDPPVLANSGPFAFRANLAPSVTKDGIFLQETAGAAITALAVDGQPAPGNDGTYFIGFPPIGPAINTSGVLAFPASLSGNAGGSSDNSGVLRTNGSAGSLIYIARKGQTPPDGNGVFGDLDNAHVVINDVGLAAFKAGLTGASSGGQEGIYRGNGSQLTKIVRTGESLPGGGVARATVGGFPALNNSGQVAFKIDYLVGSNVGYGIYRGNGGSLVSVTHSGEQVPGSTDVFNTFGRYVGLNDFGQVIFEGDTSSVPPGTAREGLFRGDGNTLTVAVRSLETLPGNDGIFRSFHGATFAMNGAGQIAFHSIIDFDPSNNTPNEGEGLYFYDDALGVLKILQSGDPFLGSTITALDFAGVSDTNRNVPAERDGLNDAGQVAFRFTLEDGRSGIALWSLDFKLINAFSRKTHGGVERNLQLALSGAPTVECRSSAGSHRLVFNFTSDVVSGNASLTTQSGGSISGSPTFDGNQMIVDLVGITDQQTITLNLSGVTNSFSQVVPAASVSMRVLVGDTTGNGSVTSSDISFTKLQSGQPVTNNNFLADVIVNGSINASDIGAVKTKSGNGASIPVSKETHLHRRRLERTK